MFSPIRATEVEAESCNAHLIPEKLRSSNVTVLAERDLDTRFGTLNDSRLIKYIRNCVGEEKEVAVEFYDEKTIKMLHRSVILTKSTIKVGDSGPRKGNINLDHLADELKSRIGLGIGSLFKVMPYSPTQEDSCRIGLSMLHSAYLTMYHHFGADYVSNENVEQVRQALLVSTSDTLPTAAALAGLRQFQVTPRFVQTFRLHNIARMTTELLAQNRHAVTIWIGETFSCFGVLLPYHQQFTGICLLPGFGERGALGFQRIMELIEGCQPIPVSRTRVVAWRPISGLSSSEFWRREVA